MKRKIIILIAVVIFISMVSSGFTISLFRDKRPVEVPPDADVQTAENIKEFQSIPAKPINLSIERKHIQTAYVDDEIEIILELENNEDEGISARVTEIQVAGLAYLDNIQTGILKYENQRIPYYYWETSIPANSSKELKYHIKSTSPRIIDFSLAFLNDQYGNQIESLTTSITVLCNPDGNCDKDENHLFCPEDCTIGLKDDNCDAVEDGINDPDCAYGIDPDYNPDDDTDGDGVLDRDDKCPGYAETDSDNDGKPDNCDRCPLDENDDADNDAVCGDADKCPNTTEDEPYEPLIYGCSCRQILDLKPGNNKGEYKNGCSPGTVNLFTRQIGWARKLFEK